MSSTDTPRIGIIVATTREGRLADKPARWIADLGAARTDLEFETLDLRDYPLPFVAHGYYDLEAHAPLDSE